MKSDNLMNSKQGRITGKGPYLNQKIRRKTSKQMVLKYLKCK